MSLYLPDAWRGCLSRRLLISAVLASVVAFTGCGGGKDAKSADQRTVRIGTGTVPQYDPQTQTLTLPQLKAGGTLHVDVKMRLKPDGSWGLLSTGSSRAATFSDKVAATLVGKDEEGLNLQNASLDATLTVSRLHAGSRVFGSMAVKLTGSKWTFVNAPQEIKTLHPEDFRSSAAISADESNHVVLNSSPGVGMQSIPMRLSARNYRFCMDRQAEGADTTTLVSPGGATAFVLRAGDACINYPAKEGEYQLEHRYGGQGASRTVFIRHQANTALPTSSQTSQLMKGPSSAPSRSLAAIQGSQALVSLGNEYWVIRDPASTPAGKRYLGFGSPTPENSHSNACRGALGIGFPFALNTLFQVQKDAVTTAPVGLGQSLACNAGDVYGFNYFIRPAFGDTGGKNYLIEHDVFTVVDSAGYVIPIEFADQPSQAPDLLATTLQIVGVAGNRFQLQAQRNPVSCCSNGPTPVLTSADGTVVNGDFEGTNISDYSSPLVVSARFFPAGLQQPVRNLGVGQVALYAGAGCSGPAFVTNDPLGNIPDLLLNSFSYLTGTLGFVDRFQSVQVGLSTRAVVRGSAGVASQFNQLTCTSLGTQAGDASNVYPMSLDIEIDTVTITVQTDACETCNLAGGDFTDVDLSGVKLQRANLSNARMAGANLTDADLRFTNMQGVVMVGANLQNANLCAAQLNESPLVPGAAILSGAHLKDTNLSQTNLDGVDFSAASFYSSGQPRSCQETSCGSYLRPSCAGASGASIQSTIFESAYLANVDMSGVTGRSVVFSNAALLGVSLSSANLAGNITAGTGSKFNRAKLQGTDFTNADLSYADFTGAQMELDSSCVQAIVGPTFLRFPGATLPASPGSSTCVAAVQPAAFCVEAIFPVSPGYPATDCHNTCADGTRVGGISPQDGSCTGTASCPATSWTSVLAAPGAGTNFPTSSCRAAAPLCGNAFASTKNLCW